MVVDFGLSTIANWFYVLFASYVFGDAIAAGIFGFIIVMIIALKAGLGADSLIVLGLFTALLFGQTALTEFPLGITFTIAISISIVGLAMLKLMRH